MTLKKKNFTAEINKVLQLVIHSIYTNKDIFLRELISNASDACDKLRYIALQDSSLSMLEEFRITVQIDKENGILIISDNGIGMDDGEMEQNLGTIAKSGTQQFIEQYQAGKANSDLIGQFGVGFYSAFMVASLVTVTSRKAGQDKTFIWESDGHSGYTIAEADEAQSMRYGTVIKMRLMPEYVEYLEKYKLQHIIKTYSDHIAFTIELIDESGVSSIINSSSALWLRANADITKEQYKEFYHHASHMPDEPWMTMHNKVEGGLTYTNLLFIPSKKPFDLFRPQAVSRVKLYVKRVFITDEGVNLIPSYMRFLCGVIDSEDLPLNISRETLQNNVTILKIRKSIIKRVINTLQKKSDEDIQSFEMFWQHFGEVLKEGLCEGAFEEKESLLDVCRFNSLNSQDKTISLAQYASEMIEGQNEIYYIIGDNLKALAQHPQLQGFKQRNIDVLLLTDNVDDFWVNVVHQYKNYALKSATSAGIDLNEVSKIEADEPVVNDDNDAIVSYIKEILKDDVKDVRISTKLINNPVCLTTPEGAMNVRMERMLIEQKQLQKRSNKILEINPQHAIVKKLVGFLKSDPVKAEQLIMILFNQACILEGESIDNPYEFISLINKFL